MTPDTTPDSAPAEEIAELERKVGELRTARAQMVAEREEHARNAARAAAVLGGLAQIQRELGTLAREREQARDEAIAESEAAASESVRLKLEYATVQGRVNEFEKRLAETRAMLEALAVEAANAAALAAQTSEHEARTRAQFGETAGAVADVTVKYEAALNEATIAESREVQFTDIEETLDREQSLAETRLRAARIRAETAQVEADLKRVRENEERLQSERATLERRLRAMRSQAEVPLAPTPAAVPARPRPTASEAEAGAAPVPSEAQRISLAARLKRDLIDPVSP